MRRVGQRRSLIGERALVDPTPSNQDSEVPQRHSLHDRMVALHAGPGRRVSRCSCKGNYTVPQVMATIISAGKRREEELVDVVAARTADYVDVVAEAVQLKRPSLHRRLPPLRARVWRRKPPRCTRVADAQEPFLREAAAAAATATAAVAALARRTLKGQSTC